MEDADHQRVRLRFFGLGDYGTYFQVEQAFKLLNQFDPSSARNCDDIVELHQALKFVEHDLFPASASTSEREALQTLRPDMYRAVTSFFTMLIDANFASTITTVDYQYHTELLTLLAKHNVFEACSPQIVLDALQSVNIGCADLLSCQPLVRAYDQYVRSLMLANAHNAEQVVAKYMQSDIQHPIFLPASFTASDSYALLDAYLDDTDANPNFINLIATAGISKTTGVTAKLKLKAKRAYEKFMRDFFKSNAGIKTGCEVTIADDQTEEVAVTLDDMVGKYSYSRTWLTDNLDFPTVLNNFIYLFEWTNGHILLTLPSYAADLGVFERYVFMTGKDNYKIGAAFRHLDQASLLQTFMYDHFLRTNNIELEQVIQWFFTEYLVNEFHADDFRYQPSSPTATYLEKSRHLFSEMESVLKQFSLFVENGSVDRELLSMSSEHLSYRRVPSLLTQKYACVADHQDILRIQHLVFSDQSHLTYITDALRDTNLARLVIANRVAYEDFLDHQKREIDFLLEQGVLEDTGTRIRFADPQHFYVLKELWDYEATSFYHYTVPGREAIHAMEAKGWIERRSSLLTSAEASYFNYWLNQAEFTDGPDLRNRYLHGSQVDGDDEHVHRQTYCIALRLLIALVVKVNDDFCLKADEAI